MSNISVGSVCSGIEAASVAWEGLGFRFEWLSEISPFPSKLLNERYGHIPNLGDMCSIPLAIEQRSASTPDLICGGTPCQAFSLAGWKRGLDDDRGNLTLRFLDIIEKNDQMRGRQRLEPTKVLWENVEGVLKDRTNAFGCFISTLAGLSAEIKLSRWPSAGLIHGPTRNVAWRLLDAKFFGLPQQRRRLYVLAGGKDFFPERVLFESGHLEPTVEYEKAGNEFVKEGAVFQVFRSYTDCLYSAYGTKWNGNAAAYNGSLFVVQDGRLRRFCPEECEALMGFPKGYTELSGARPTSRFQAIGNSWAVPVIRWIGRRLIDTDSTSSFHWTNGENVLARSIFASSECIALDMSASSNSSHQTDVPLNCSDRPISTTIGSLCDVVDPIVDDQFYITPAGCKGILRRKEERGMTMNRDLEFVLRRISSEWDDAKIEGISRRQSRGRFSKLSKESGEESSLLNLFP